MLKKVLAAKRGAAKTLQSSRARKLKDVGKGIAAPAAGALEGGLRGAAKTAASKEGGFGGALRRAATKAREKAALTTEQQTPQRNLLKGVGRALTRSGRSVFGRKAK